MKNLRYIYFAALGFTLMLSSACVKNTWSDPSRPELLPPSQYVTTLDMDFNNEAKVDGQYMVMPKGWLNTGANGTHRAFQTAITAYDYRYADSDSIQCASVTAYLCLGDAEAWLVTPPIKVAGVANANFYYSAFWAYTAGSIFQVLCYSANSSQSTIPPLDESEWQVLADYTSGPSDMRNMVQKQHNLSTFLAAGDDVMYVAFRYRQDYLGAGATGSTTWYVDDIKYNK